MTDLIRVVNRCEMASGPDRDLDLAIYLALWPASDLAKITERPRGLNGGEGYSWDIQHGAVVFEKWTEDGRCPHNGGYPLPAFTGSLDAAASLVPGEWYWQVGYTSAYQAWANVYKLHPDHTEDGKDEFHANRAHWGPQKWTPILALCHAALRARASLVSSNK